MHVHIPKVGYIKLQNVLINSEASLQLYYTCIYLITHECHVHKILSHDRYYKDKRKKPNQLIQIKNRIFRVNARIFQVNARIFRVNAKKWKDKKRGILI